MTTVPPTSTPSAAQGRATAARAAAMVRERFGEAVIEHVTFRDEETLRVDPARLVEICRFLRDEPQLSYEVLTDITAIHYLEREHEYAVAYLLSSMTTNSMLRLKVLVGGDLGPGSVPTVTGVWGTADWLEREEWDKVGVVFEGHPNLKRILMPEDWEGHPLRRDYPVEGIGA